MKKVTIALLALLGFIFIVPQTGNAIPAFARKYGFNCNVCHTSFIKLNDFGQRYRDYGYQIPGQEGYEKNVFETAPPLAIRTSFGLSLIKSHSTTSGFNIYGFDFLAAGVLHKNISFLMIYTPRIDEPAADYRGSAGGSNPSQLAAVESGNILFSNLITDALNLRIGRFEPAYHAVSSKRSYYINQPYEIYTFAKPEATPNINYLFDDNQMGIEAAGHFKNGFHYGLGVVNGTGASPDNNTYKDLYLDLYQVFGRGEGQSAGQRIGAFGYLGWQPAILPSLDSMPAGAEFNGGDNKSFYRVGGDLSLNYKTFNLRALFMQGKDNKAFNNLDSTKDYKYNGGFVELDYAALPNNRLLISAMYNMVHPPSYDESNRINAFSGLIRYYLGDWTAVNVALHAEYTHREVGKDQPSKEDIFLFLVDFDF